MSEVVVGVILLLGGTLAVLGSFGLVRMPDVLIRMHASTKIGTLSTGLILAASAVWFGEGGVTVRAGMIFFFLLLTAPIASHMIGRAAVRLGVPLFEGTDEHR